MESRRQFMKRLVSMNARLQLKQLVDRRFERHCGMSDDQAFDGQEADQILVNGCFHHEVEGGGHEK